ATAASVPAPNNRTSRRVRRRSSSGSISKVERGRSPKKSRALLFMSRDLRPLYSCRPASDHAAQRIPPVGENQNHMGNNEKDDDPHEPEMPNARRIEPAK